MQGLYVIIVGLFDFRVVFTGFVRPIEFPFVPEPMNRTRLDKFLVSKIGFQFQVFRHLHLHV